MGKNKSVLDDLGKMANSMFANIVNVKNEISAMIAEQLKTAIKNLDFVSKKDFDALKKLVVALNKEVADLKKSKPAVKKQASKITIN